MMRYGGYLVGPGQWLVILIGLAVLVAAVAVVLWVLLRSRGPVASPPAAPRDDNALMILRERLARGEITPTEYEETRRVLGG